MTTYDPISTANHDWQSRLDHFGMIFGTSFMMSVVSSHNNLSGHPRHATRDVTQLRGDAKLNDMQVAECEVCPVSF